MTMRSGLFEDVDAAGVRVFGETVSIGYSDLPSVDVDGVWEAPGERVDVVDGFAIASSSPSVGLHLADLPRSPAQGDTITHSAVVYNVGEVVPDGHGGVFVELVRPRPA